MMITQTHKQGFCFCEKEELLRGDSEGSWARRIKVLLSVLPYNTVNGLRLRFQGRAGERGLCPLCFSLFLRHLPPETA